MSVRTRQCLSRPKPIRGRALLLGLAVVLAPTRAFAAPEEIQVYIDDMDAPGEVGLDMHVNYVGTGETTSNDYPGAQDSLHRLRITPEFSIGLTDQLEAGLYLPLATVDRNGQLEAGGIKARLKYVAHPGGNPDIWYGVNFELGRVDRLLDINPWNAEAKLMAGARRGPWTLAFNANIDFVVAGPDPVPASLELATKASYNVTRKVAIGFEAYNGMGPLKALGRFAGSDQSLFAAADIDLGAWNLNLGLGRGFGANPDGFVAKVVLGIPIDRLLHGPAGRN